MSVVSEWGVASESLCQPVTRRFPASVAAKCLLIDCFQGGLLSDAHQFGPRVSALRGRWPQLARTAPAAFQSEAPTPRATPPSFPPHPHHRRSPRPAPLSWRSWASRLASPLPPWRRPAGSRKALCPDAGPRRVWSRTDSGPGLGWRRTGSGAPAGRAEPGPELEVWWGGRPCGGWWWWWRWRKLKPPRGAGWWSWRSCWGGPATGWKAGRGPPGGEDDGGGGGGEEEGGAGLWSGSTAPTGPGSAGVTSAAPPYRRRSGQTRAQKHRENIWVSTEALKKKKKKGGPRRLSPAWKNECFVERWGRKRMKCDRERTEKWKESRKTISSPHSVYCACSTYLTFQSISIYCLREVTVILCVCVCVCVSDQENKKNKKYEWRRFRKEMKGEPRLIHLSSALVHWGLGAAVTFTHTVSL